jgi:hypothetical protein
MLFGTARWDRGYLPTGIADQVLGRDYGQGLWALHWKALLRLTGRDHLAGAVLPAESSPR